MGGLMTGRLAGIDRRRALAIAAQVALAAWFAYWSWQILRFYFESFPYHLDMFGFDSRIYLHGAQTWLAGGDPWTAYASQHAWPQGAGDVPYYFTGPPPTVLAFAPFAWLPDAPFTAVWQVLTVGSALYILRRLRLPVWWLLFPPLAQAVFIGNPHVVCLALILSGWSVLRALAPAVKAYAVIPMVGERQWRALGILAVAGTLSLVAFWPLWSQYAADYQHIQTWISNATWGGFSASRDPRLFVVAGVALAALAVIDFRAAGWLVVPAMWPAAEYFYASFALPLRSPWLMAALAVPATQATALVPWTIVAYALARVGLAVFRWWAPAPEESAPPPGLDPEDAGAL